MNIKIKSSGVSCLIGEDYDRVYTALKSQLVDEECLIFTERIPGHEYLQWDLPGEGWTALSEGDPLMARNVKQELDRRRQIICQRFGSNQNMAQRILTVPDDSYVYYKANDDGHLQIRLTAWGYRYPERIGGGGVTGFSNTKGDTQNVSICIFYDSNPLPNKTFFLNGYKRETDESGCYQVGDLPIGYKLNIKVDDKQQIFDIQPGQGEIVIDSTIFASVEISALLDGKPYNDANVSLSYWGHESQITTDSKGKAFFKLPKDPNNGLCTVSIGNECQQQTLVQPVTLFSFDIVTPKEEEREEIDEQYPPSDTDEDNNTVSTEPVQPSTEEDYPEESQTPINDDQPLELIEDSKNDNVEDVQQNEIEPLDTTSVPTGDNQRSSSIIGELLAALSLLALVYVTYWFCYGMLFG